MAQKLAGMSLRQPHEVLNFQVVVQFRLFFCGKWRGFLPFDEIPDTIARCRGRLEFDHFARTQRSDELNDFFKRSHGA